MKQTTQDHLERYGRNASLQIIDGIGGAFEYRIEYFTGISTLGELADADPETLETVFGIGHQRAREFLGKAQGLMKLVTEQQPDVTPDHDKPENWVSRLGIMFGNLTRLSDSNTLPVGVEPNELIEKIDEALEVNDIAIDEDTQVGMFMPNFSDSFGIAGSSVVREWLDKEQVKENCFKQPELFYPKFGLYYLFVDEETFDSWRYGPDTRSELRQNLADNGKSHSVRDIPDRYQVARAGDAEVWMAIDEQQRALAEWAHTLLLPVVDGTAQSRADMTVKIAEQECNVVTHEQLDLRTGVYSTYTRTPDVEAPEIEPEQGIANRMYAVRCPECAQLVYLDSPVSAKMCGTCWDDTEGEQTMTMVNENNAQEVLGWLSVTPTHEREIDEADDDTTGELLETGVIERDESEWSKHPDDESDTGGGGVGRNWKKNIGPDL